MIKDINLTLSPKEAGEGALLRKAVSAKLGIKCEDITAIRALRTSIDARRRDVHIQGLYRVFIGEEENEIFARTEFKDVSKSPKAIIVGAGPAGLFAALTLLEKGIAPIVLERGKDVKERTYDCASLSREGVLDPESNYAFGLGGAGAFSDGKLFTRSDKRGNVQKVLSLFCQHGADLDILSDAHPHIGSDLLPKVIANMRDTIINKGGIVRCSTRVSALIEKRDAVVGVKTSSGEEILGPVILAAGHSARDIYTYLDQNGYAIEPKDVAVGVRLEHPQHLIDEMQYHSSDGRGRYLPAASYSFVTQVEGRGVYSFCMCPGGYIIPASTEQGALVVNGMSGSRRSSPYANSGMVVQLSASDVGITSSLGMLDYLEAIERRCFQPLFKAPAQRMGDFVHQVVSRDLPASSYAPGLVSMAMDDVLPPLIAKSLRSGFIKFGDLTRGRFLTNEAVLIAPETRTSSPVRILRGDDYAQKKGFYPAGEGAGYAGGIVSSALDGIAAATALASTFGI